MNDNIIYRMDGLPVQQNRFFATVSDAIACPLGDVILVHDPLTGIVHNAAFRTELMSYDENYQNEQGYSNVFEQHLYKVMEVIRRHFKLIFPPKGRVWKKYGMKTNESKVLINYVNMLTLRNQGFVTENRRKGKNDTPSCAKLL